MPAEVSPGDASGMRRLRERWFSLAAIDASVLIIGVTFLRNAWSEAAALRWSLLASLLLIYQLAFVWRRLPRNIRRLDGQLLPVFGLGNGLTLFRGVLLAALGGFLMLPLPQGGWAWIPAILYTCTDVGDYFDGLLARLRHEETYLGEDLDIEFDALGLLLAVCLGVAYGKLPIWYLGIGVTRYAFLAGQWLLRRSGKLVLALPPSQTRRPIAGLTMGFASAMLWPIVRPPATTLAGWIFAVPLLLSFGRDWLVVSGVLQAGEARYLRWRWRAKRLAFTWLPLLPRAGIVVCGAAFLLADGSIAWAGLSMNWGTGSVHAAFRLIEIVCGVFIAFGCAGRLAAFVLLFPLGLTIAGLGPTPLSLAWLSAALLVLLLGTGAASLWQPETKTSGLRPGTSPAA